MAPRIPGIVLAAGSSRRLGRPKQLVRVGDRTLLARVVSEICAASCHPVAVVLGPGSGAIAASLARLPVMILANPLAAEGMASSIRVAIGWADTAGADGALLCLCDQPGLTAAHLDRLIAAHRATGSLVASRYDGVLGVPALFPRAEFRGLRSLAGDRGAREVIRAAAYVTAIDWPEGAIDIDTAADGAAISRSSG